MTAEIARLTPVTQTTFYDPDAPPERQRGNCLTAVVASLLNLPIEAVPNFVQDDVDHGNDDPEWNWWTRLHRFAQDHGHDVIYLRAADTHPDNPMPDPEPGEHYAVIGISPRDPKIHHIVIYRDGQMVHDPHPDRTGLVSITDEWHWTLRPISTGKADPR